MGEAEPPGHGDVFLADEQTAGRGQGNNSWFATPGANLSFSLICYPDHLSVDQIFALTQVPALALVAAVREWIPAELAARVKLKWPNDVYVDDQKIAGILVQNGLRGNTVAWTVIGIGFNVNEVNFPPDLAASATSLKQLVGRSFDRKKVLDRVLHHLASAYSQTAPTELAQLRSAYHRELYRLNLPGRYRRTQDGTTFFAILRGVAAGGRLRLEHASGEEELFSLREVGFI